MVRRGRGHIIVMTSIAAREVYPFGLVYCATKHALSALARGLRVELQSAGIKVTEVAPGSVDTQIRATSTHPRVQEAFKSRRFTPLSPKRWPRRWSTPPGPSPIAVPISSSCARAARPDFARNPWTRKPSRASTSSTEREEDFDAGLRSYAKYRDLDLATVTAGMVQAHVIRLVPPVDPKVVSKWHYHDVDLQMIYVLNGWIKTEFEGKGVHTMKKGTTWLQPPKIQHTRARLFRRLRAARDRAAGAVRHRRAGVIFLRGGGPQ